MQGRVLDIVQQTWARGGVFAFFSGNEAGARSARPWYYSQAVLPPSVKMLERKTARGRC